DLGTLAQEGNVSRVVIADPEIQEDSATTHALIDLKLRGIRIETAIETFERTNRKIWIEGLSPNQLIFADGFSASKVYLGAKRLFDIVLSVLLLVLTA